MKEALHKHQLSKVVSRAQPNAEKQVHNHYERKNAFSNLSIQPKLTVGDTNDPLEREADAMADQVMRMSEGKPIQHQSAHHTEENIQREDEEEQQPEEKKLNLQLTEPDILSLKAPFFDRNVPHLWHAGSALGVWHYNFDFFRKFGLDNNKAGKAANLTAPFFINSQLKAANPTWWEITDREMNTSSITGSLPLINFDSDFRKWKLLPFIQKKGLDNQAVAAHEKTQDQTFIQRKCADCEAEEKAQRKSFSPGSTSYIQTKSEGSTATSSEVSNAIESSLGSGAGMDSSTKSFMNSRFGNDFSGVKIHTDSQSEELNRSLQAKAFTVGNDIYFNQGQYQPQSSSGRHLLAHELTHTLQQGNGIQRQPHIQRTPTTEALEKEAIKLETDILASSQYTGLLQESKDRVKRIIAIAKTKPVGDASGQRNYYFKKLQIALTTPFNGTETGKAEYGCSEDAAKKNKKAVEDALYIEKTWWDGEFADVEEKAVASGTQKTKRAGQGGKKFYVDRSDPRNIRVQIKVKLKGKAEEVASIKKLEDAIERDSHTAGYYLDIVFVDSTGEDVFEFTVSFCQWANAGNWASGPTTLSHEVHHALGLPDRYDYIESHTKNQQMNVPMRLVWFEAQMKKTGGPRDLHSKMARNTNPLLSEDICAIAFESVADQKKCINARKDMDPAGIPPI